MKIKSQFKKSLRASIINVKKKTLVLLLIALKISIYLKLNFQHNNKFRFIRLGRVGEFC